jgi:hypothetical protein
MAYGFDVSGLRKVPALFLLWHARRLVSCHELLNNGGNVWLECKSHLAFQAFLLLGIWLSAPYIEAEWMTAKTQKTITFKMTGDVTVCSKRTKSKVAATAASEP